MGRIRNKCKAHLKLVPIISKCFTKINLDAVDKFKYPDIFPLENITSKSVTDALVNIFC